MAIPQSVIYGMITAEIVLLIVGRICYLYPKYRNINGEAQQYQENLVLGAGARVDWEEERGRSLQMPRRAARREGGGADSHSTNASFELA